MVSEMDLAGIVIHEYFMASGIVVSIIAKLLSVTYKLRIKQIFKRPQNDNNNNSRGAY